MKEEKPPQQEVVELPVGWKAHGTKLLATHTQFTGARYNILYDSLLRQCFSNFPAQACVREGHTLLVCLGDKEKVKNILW